MAASLLDPGPTLLRAEELRQQRGTRGLLEAVGSPLSYAPNPVVSAIGQGLLGARYLTGEADPRQGLASLSDMTAMMVGSQLPPAMRHIFAGAKALTADKAKLAKAQELDKAGVDNRSIWQQTGWFKGPDGQWRFEIDDSTARLKRLPVENLRTNINDYPPVYVQGHAKNSSLSDILSHQGLYDAYPNAAKHGFADVEFGPGVKEAGKYRRFEDIQDTPSVPNISVSASGPKKARSVLLHEIQHGVQEREGFARGASSDTASIPQIDEINSRLSWASKEMDAMKSHFYDSDPTVAAKAKEQYGLLKQHYMDLLNERSNINPYDSYRRVAGEAEARAVQARMNMTPKQRGLLFPLDSYDVPLDQLIYR